MKTRMLASTLVLVVCAVPVSMAGFDPDPPSFALGKSDNQTELKVSGYKCVAKTNCNSSAVDFGFALIGCTGGTACVGTNTCYTCAATGVSHWVCTSWTYEDCIYGGATAGTYVCGVRTYGNCGTGTGGDINGCVCTVTGLASSETCELTNCLQ